MLLFRVYSNKRLVTYKWSDIEEGIYNKGVYLEPEELGKVADVAVDRQGRVAGILYESGHVKTAVGTMSKTAISVHRNAKTTWHSIAVVRQKTNKMLICGLNQEPTKWTHVLVMVDKQGKEIATSTIEMESNSGNID